ncbi:MAG: TetR family transcriptional regulator [Lysobacter sp.]
MSTLPPPAPRPRNAAATREAILQAARIAFARAGYEGAGLREIASAAGVTAVLVNRYFGSKEQLFAEVLAATMAQPHLLTQDNLGSGALGERIAAELLDITRGDAQPLEGFQIMLRSASSERAAQIGREQIEGHYLKLLSGALGGEQAEQRAALVFALVAGVQVMRQMIGLSALTDAEPEALKTLLAPLFRQLVENAPAAQTRPTV